MQLIYIGPTIDRLGLSKYRIYICDNKDKLKATHQRAIASFPHIMRLFVNVSSLTKSEMAMKEKGTPLNMALNEIIRRR